MTDEQIDRVFNRYGVEIDRFSSAVFRDDFRRAVRQVVVEETERLVDLLRPLQKMLDDPNYVMFEHCRAADAFLFAYDAKGKVTT